MLRLPLRSAALLQCSALWQLKRVPRGVFHASWQLCVYGVAICCCSAVEGRRTGVPLTVREALGGVIREWLHCKHCSSRPSQREDQHCRLSLIHLRAALHDSCCSAGESYAGVYVPLLARSLLSARISGSKAPVNIQVGGPGGGGAGPL
jgi:hypothetical protein